MSMDKYIHYILTPTSHGDFSIVAIGGSKVTIHYWIYKTNRTTKYTPC
jgi:hypothetical protein